MALLGKLFWIALTLVFTFCFVVLFEYGTVDFAGNAGREFQNVKAMFVTKPKANKTDPGDQVMKP